jgi:hypothetical protein
MVHNVLGWKKCSPQMIRNLLDPPCIHLQQVLDSHPARSNLGSAKECQQLLACREGEGEEEEEGEEALLVASPATHTGNAKTMSPQPKRRTNNKLQTS